MKYREPALWAIWILVILILLGALFAVTVAIKNEVTAGSTPQPTPTSYIGG